MNGRYTPRLEPGTLVLFEGCVYRVIGRNGGAIHLKYDDIKTCLVFWTTTDKVHRLLTSTQKSQHRRVK